MKILLVKPVTPPNFVINVVPPIGLGYLATALRQNGFKKIKILDCVKEGLTLADFKREVKKFKPDLVGWQIFSHDLESLKESLAIVKASNPKTITLAGGPHPSGFSEEVLADFSQLDYAFKGEAEIGLPLLVKKIGGEKIDLSKIPGLIWRRGKKIVVNQQVFFCDLDKLGLPAWDLLKPQDYPEAPQGVIFKNLPIAPVMATRGCPFQCTFCAGKTVTGLKIRSRSITNLLAEIELLYRDYGIREIHFLDDNFTFNKQYVKDFCRQLLQKDFKISWCCPNGVRLDTLDLEVLTLMKKAGCYYISVGIESGSDRILKLMRKSLKVKDIRRQIKLIKRAGLTVNGFFILGYPGETKKEMEKTIKFSQNLGLTRAAFYNFLPLPGTEAYRQLIQTGEISADGFDFSRTFQSETPYSPKGVSKSELKKLQEKAYWQFYLRPAVLFALLKEIRSYNQIKYLFRRARTYLKF